MPKIVAATGIDSSPAWQPCELDAMTTMTMDETTVAIVDFFIIPTYNGKSPNIIAEMAVTACTHISPKLNVTNTKYLLARRIQAYWKIYDTVWNRSIMPQTNRSFANISFVRFTG